MRKETNEVMMREGKSDVMVAADKVRKFSFLVSVEEAVNKAGTGTRHRHAAPTSLSSGGKLSGRCVKTWVRNNGKVVPKKKRRWSARVCLVLCGCRFALCFVRLCFYSSSFLFRANSREPASYFGPCRLMRCNFLC